MLEKLNYKIDQLEFSRYALMSFTITVGSCWGSVAILFMAMNDAALWQIATCAALTMASNALGIALAPIRLLVWTFVLSFVVNAMLLLANML